MELRSVVWATAIVLPLVLTGCLGGPDAPENAAGDQLPSQGDAGPTRVNQTWTRAAHGNPWFLEAHGVPFYSIFILDGCEGWAFDVPRSTTRLQVTLSGPAVNDSRTPVGSGYATFMLHGADGQVAPEPSQPPAERVELSVDDPSAGEWLAWVWPHGVVENQVYELQVVLEGTGPEPAEALELTGQTLPGNECSGPG